MKKVENRKDYDPQGQLMYVMDRLIKGKWVRQVVVINRQEERNRNVVAFRLRMGRVELRRMVAFVEKQ